LVPTHSFLRIVLNPITSTTPPPPLIVRHSCNRQPTLTLTLLAQWRVFHFPCEQTAFPTLPYFGQFHRIYMHENSCNLQQCTTNTQSMHNIRHLYRALSNASVLGLRMLVLTINNYRNVNPSCFALQVLTGLFNGTMILRLQPVPASPFGRSTLPSSDPNFAANTTELSLL